MLSDRIFKVALLLSIAGHFVFFYGWPGSRQIFPDEKIKNPPEITYYQPKQNLTAKPPVREKKALSVKDFKTKKEKFTKKDLSVAKVTPEQKERVTTPSGEIFKAPEEKSLYLDYYQSIREKIRRVANYNYYNYSKIGEIYLSFILKSDGILKNIELFDNKSSPDGGLRKIALNTVKEASPFPPFPEGLSQKQLSFNVIISFEKGN